MTQKRATLYALMNECAATERSVAGLWAWGQKQLNTGSAVPDQLGLIDVLSQRLYAQQQALYAPVVEFVRGLPAAARDEILPLMPRLGPLPRLSLGGSRQSPGGIRGAGLGVVPLVIGGVAIPAGALVIGALLVLALSISVLVFFFQSFEMVGDLVGDVQALRADAADAERRLRAQQGRYQECLTRGGTPQTCAAAFPLPSPTRFALDREEHEDQNPVLIGLAAVGGLVALGGLLYVGIRAYRAASPYRALREALP